jgi:hypothetical protein
VRLAELKEKMMLKLGDIVRVPGTINPRYTQEIGTVVSIDYCEVDGYGFPIEIANVYLETGRLVSLDSIYVEKIV